MSISEELLLKGWHLSPPGMDVCKEGLEKASALTIIGKALDTDLRDIGAPFLSDEIQKGKVDSISGPCILQIQKLRNVASPKYETSNNHHVFLRLLLTDGHAYISCLQWDSWKSVTLDTPPGSKLFIKSGKVPVQNGFLLLKESQFILLGGQVAPMVEKWELSKQFASHQRRSQGLEDGPPPWIPFGKSINYKATKASAGNFRSLDPEAKKEEKEDGVFKQQRMANIAEISRSKEGKRKVFGGGRDCAGNENTLNSTSSSHGQDRKYFSDNTETYKNNNQSRVLKQLDKKPHAEAMDYQGRNYDLESKDFSYPYPEDYRYKNPSGFQQNRETNQYMENAKFGRAENNSQGHTFHRNSSTDFHPRENRSDNFYSNANFGHLKFQDGCKANENSFQQLNYGNTSFNSEDMQDRQHFTRGSNNHKGENRFNHNAGYRNAPANRRGVNRREEVVYQPESLPEPFSEAHFPALDLNQDRSHFSGVLEFRRGGNRPFIHRNDENFQDKQRDRLPRQGHKPATKLYQPPRQRRG